MDTIEEWRDILENALNEIGTKIGEYLPSVLGALVVFIVGVLIAKGLRRVLRKVLEFGPIDRTLNNTGTLAALKRAGLSVSLTDLILRVAYWILMLIVLMTVTGILGLDALTDTLKDILGYLPDLLAAAIILAVAIYAARLLRDIVTAGLTAVKFGFTRSVATVVQVVVIIFGATIAASQLGIDTAIITANVTVIVGGIMLTLAIAVGLGTRDLVKSIAVKHYAETDFEVGKAVSIAGVSGKVERVSNLGITIKAKGGSVFVPHSSIV